MKREKLFSDCLGTCWTGLSVHHRPRADHNGMYRCSGMQSNNMFKEISNTNVSLNILCSLNLFIQASFTALNLSDDEIDIEEHTRELQIEIALNTLNKALKLQKDKKFDEARLSYEELGRIEIVSLPNLSNHLTINRLKYLFFRNRGMLRLKELIESLKKKEQPDRSRNNGNDDDEADDDADDDDDDVQICFNVYAEIIGSINDFLNATLFGDPDIKLIQILSSLFKHFGYTRLARLCYELILNDGHFSNSPDTDLKIDLERPDNLLNSQVKLLEQYLELLKTLNVNNKMYYKVQKCLAGSRFWSNLKAEGRNRDYKWDSILNRDEWMKERESNRETLIIDVDIENEDDGSINLSSFFESLVDTLPKLKGRNQIYDGYTLTKTMVDKLVIEFNYADDDTKGSGDDMDVIEITDETPNGKFPGSDAATSTEMAAAAPALAAEKIIETSSDDKNLLEVVPTIAAPKPAEKSISRSTRSTRGKTETEPAEEIKVTLENYDMFISKTLPAFLKLCDIHEEFKPLNDLVLNQSHAYDRRVQIFYNSLRNWNDEFTQCLCINEPTSKSNKSTNSANSIREILSVNPSKAVNMDKFPAFGSKVLYDYLLDISKQNVHFNHLRRKVVEFMLKSNTKNGLFFFCVRKMDDRTVKKFRQVVDTVSLSFLKKLEAMVYYGNGAKLTNESLNICDLSVAIYELLVGTYLEFKNDQKLKKNSYKNTENQQSENIMIKQIDIWEELLADVFGLYTSDDSMELKIMWSRYIWFKINYSQVSVGGVDLRTLTTSLVELSATVSKFNISLPYINYNCIPSLNEDNVQAQYSKLAMLEIFNKEEDSYAILEDVLLAKKPCYTDVSKTQIFAKFESFVTTSNTMLKIRLWSLLLHHYKASNEILKYKFAYENIMELLINEITVENMASLSEYECQIRILHVLGFFVHFSKMFIEFSAETNFSVFEATSTPAVKQINHFSFLLYLLYTFIMNHRATYIDSRVSLSAKSLKSYDILNECVFCCFMLISLYYPLGLTEIKDTTIVDCLGIFHEELSVLKLCQTLSGSFLKYMQFKLCRLDYRFSTPDLLQTLNCQYGLTFCIDGFETVDHKCKHTKLQSVDAIQLSGFLKQYCYSKKNPLISPPKMDIKVLIDYVVEAVGDPPSSDLIICKNQKLLDDYLDSSKIDLEFIIKSFQTTLDPNFEKATFKGSELGKNSIYYLEGITGLHTFKARKKTMQSRIAELAAVLKMFRNDIICGYSSLENWIALGQTYSYLAEDDLIWTADKLNSYERKQVIAMTQKRSLLSYLMAINIYIRSSSDEKKSYEPFISTLWTSFGKELYSAWVEPMDKKAFHVITGGTTEDDAAISLINNDIPSTAIFKILELTFKIAYSFDQNDWYTLVYLSKSQMKLKYQEMDHDTILQNLIASCNLALKQSNKEDPIMEPHYYLYSAIFKFYKEDKITTKQCIEYLKGNELFSPVLNENYMISFKDLTYTILKKIISYDKKNWQHRPIFRMSQYYYFMDNNVSEAKTELQKILNLKPNIRSLSTIWKPSHELPGKHFLYNSKYTMFLNRLLYETGDIHSICVLIKKLRRASSIMVHITKTFDNAVLRLCLLIKKMLKMTPSYLDDNISKIKFSDFTKYSNEFISYLKGKDPASYNMETRIQLHLLSETHSFRKSAVGFGATGVIDDCYHSLYIKLFIPFLLRRLIEDKCSNITARELFLNAKIAQNDVSRTRGDTPGFTNFDIDNLAALNAEETKETTPGLNEMGDVDTTSGMINLDDIQNWAPDFQLFIINYLSVYYDSISNTPSKEKVRVARRDVTPFATKVVYNTDGIVNDLRQETNDGETIEYKFPGDLTNEDYDRNVLSIVTKETKENKEDRDYEKIISSHDRSFKADELQKFNLILTDFGVSALRPYITNSEQQVLDEKQKEGNPKNSESSSSQMDDAVSDKVSKPTDAESQILESNNGHDNQILDRPKNYSLIHDVDAKRTTITSEVATITEDPFLSPSKKIPAKKAAGFDHILDSATALETGVKEQETTSEDKLQQSGEDEYTGTEQENGELSVGNHPVNIFSIDSSQGSEPSELNEETPVRKTQPVITSFFKITPKSAPVKTDHNKVIDYSQHESPTKGPKIMSGKRRLDDVQKAEDLSSAKKPKHYDESAEFNQQATHHVESGKNSDVEGRGTNLEIPHSIAADVLHKNETARDTSIGKEDHKAQNANIPRIKEELSTASEQNKKTGKILKNNSVNNETHDGVAFEEVESSSGDDSDLIMLN